MRDRDGMKMQDIYRTAEMLVKKYGEDEAILVCLDHLREKASVYDERGERKWDQIISAIAVLRRTEIEIWETLH